MQVPDRALEQVRDHGYAVVEGFLDADELRAARHALWDIYPHPDDYFADPDAHPKLRRHQFAGLRLFPFDCWAIDRLAYHPDLVDAAERLLGSKDLDLYKIELWGKYAGAVDYDQVHHYDYGNHSLVVPRRDGRCLQMTTFLLLSDVSEQDGPTRLVPAPLAANTPFVPREQPPGAFADDEIAITGPAGTLFIYHTGILHRGSDFTAPRRSRFVLLADYQVRGLPWMGKMSWPGRALQAGWQDVLVRASVRERDLFGFPPPGSDYWNEQTLADVAARWPGIDLAPYRPG
ncbi:MAG: phytanoyl-CoA dioxygenase family protein [Pseudomonadales bacterium]